MGHARGSGIPAGAELGPPTGLGSEDSEKDLLLVVASQSLAPILEALSSPGYISCLIDLMGENTEMGHWPWN